MTKTHMVIKSSRQPVSEEQKAVLDARAARFKMDTSSGPSSTSTISMNSNMDPAEAEKRAARAARFADVKAAPSISTSGKVSLGATTTTLTSTSVVDAEKLAKRAARFADIPK